MKRNFVHRPWLLAVALLKFNPTDFVINQSGSSGGATYSRNRGGQYRKIKPLPGNPQTTYQQAVRAQFTTLSQAWRALTDAQRATWNTGAADFPYIDNIGNTRIPSGFQLFKSLNGTLLACGEASLTSCPAPIANPGTILSTLVVDSSSNNITITTSTGTSVAVFGMIYATPPVGPGIYNNNNKYRHICTIATGTSDAAASTTITAAYIARFGDITGQTGQRVELEIVPANDSGQQGTGSFLSTLVQA